jgi:hypothetical protein
VLDWSRQRLVARFATFTWAPDTAARAGSRTTPAIVPFGTWASAAPAKTKTSVAILTVPSLFDRSGGRNWLVAYGGGRYFATSDRERSGKKIIAR